MSLIKKSVFFWVLLEGVLLLVFALPYLLHPNSLDVYDAPSHVSLARFLKEELFPSYLGWNPQSLLGFPQGLFYPPLLHWIAALLGFAFELEVVFKFLVTAALLASPVTGYYWFKTLFQKEDEVLLATGLLTGLLLVLPGYLGVGWSAAVEIGLLPSFISLPVLLLFFSLINKGKYRLGVLVLSCLILLHLVAAAVGLLYCVLSALEKKKRVSALKVVGLSLLSTSFFWLPFVVFGQEISVSRHPSPQLFFSLVSFWLALSALLLWKARNQVVVLVILSLSSILLLDRLGSLMPINSLSERLYSLHLYRFEAYLALFLLPLVLVAVLRIVRISSKNVFNASFALAVVLAAFGLMQNPALEESDSFSFSQQPLREERFIEGFSRAQSFPFVYSAQESLVESDSTWAYGLFTDAVQTGPYLGSLAYTLSGATRVPESEFIETTVLSDEKSEQALGLFGINHILVLSDNEVETLGKMSFQGEDKNFSLEFLEPTNLVVPINTELELVREGWDDRVKAWWEEESSFSQLLVNDPESKLQTIAQNPGAQVSGLQHNKNWSQFSFEVLSDTKTAVLAKFSYSPFWKAENEDESIPIYRVSPNLMMVVAKGQVNFSFDLPDWILWLFVLGFLTSLVTLTRREVLKDE